MGGKKFDANETKTQLKLAISRIKLQKNKKDNNIKNNKREIAELLKNGKDESARIKVENIIREDFVIEAYEILELFCELLLARLGVIQISKDCPPDLREAVCTMIYAAPRTDIKELSHIREQLIHKFGKEFGMASMANKENCVNPRVVHKLSIQTPENYIVFQYLNEIAKAFGLEWKTELAPEPVGAIPQTTTVTPNLSFPEPPHHTSSPANFSPIPPPTSTPAPSFPEPPKFDVNNIPVPNFNFNGLPGVSHSDVPPPNFNQPPPVQNHGLPDFPVIPSNNAYNNAPPPSFPSFPTPPSNNGTMRPLDNAPTLDFPTPPGADNTPEMKDSSVPDFDELTARFEKLKKRDQ